MGGPCGQPPVSQGPHPRPSHLPQLHVLGGAWRLPRPGVAVCGVTADVRSRRRAWHWRAPPGAAGPAPLVLRARGAGGASGKGGVQSDVVQRPADPRGRCGASQTGLGTNSTDAARDAAGTGPEPESGGRRRRPTAQLRAHRAGSAGSARRPTASAAAEGRGPARAQTWPGRTRAAGADCSPQKPPRSRVCPKTRLGVSGPLPAGPGLGPPRR